MTSESSWTHLSGLLQGAVAKLGFFLKSILVFCIFAFFFCPAFLCFQALQLDLTVLHSSRGVEACSLALGCFSLSVLTLKSNRRELGSSPVVRDYLACTQSPGFNLQHRWSNRPSCFLGVPLCDNLPLRMALQPASLLCNLSYSWWGSCLPHSPCAKERCTLLLPYCVVGSKWSQLLGQLWRRIASYISSIYPSFMALWPIRAFCLPTYDLAP